MKRLLLIVLFAFIASFSWGQNFTIETSPNVGFFMIDSVDYVKGYYELRYEGRTNVDTLRRFSIVNIYDGREIINSRYFDAITDVDSWGELSQLLVSVGLLNNNDVSIQDQHTPILIVKFNRVIKTTTTTSSTVIGEYTVDVTSTDSIAVGRYFIVFSSATGRVYIGTVTNVSGSTITVDTPFDSALPIGADVDVARTDFAFENGSVTPVIYGIRGQSEGEPIGASFDITRIIFKCIATSAVDLTTFGDLTKLTRGLVLRKRDGTVQNLFNVKDNGELAGIMFDLNIEAATNPQQGIDGFTGRLTFAGQSKIGVTVRLAAGEDLEFIIQDDLTGLTLFEVIAEGHIVE